MVVRALKNVNKHILDPMGLGKYFFLKFDDGLKICLKIHFFWTKDLEKSMDLGKIFLKICLLCGWPLEIEIFGSDDMF